jgi:hypothetical protein
MSAKRLASYRQAAPVPLLNFHRDLGEIQERFSGPVAVSDQFVHPNTAALERPEMALMRAVLEDALECFQKQFLAPGPHTQRLAREAEEWFFTNDNHWLFSFVHICDALGLDANYIRRGLKQWRQSQQKKESNH